MIVLEERNLDEKTSRMQSTWTYLLQKDSKTLKQKKQITIDQRVWSLHELVAMFERTGWKIKAIHHGFNQRQPDVPLQEARSLLVIARKPRG